MLGLRSALLGLAVFALGCAGASEADPLLGEPCAADADCGELHCVADRDAKPEDLADLPLVCGAFEGEGSAGDECEAADDCARGICLLAGACAKPCERDADCGKRERCSDVFARTAPGALQSLRACTAIVDLPDDADIASRVHEDGLIVGTRDVTIARGADELPVFAVLEHLDPLWPGMTCRPPLCIERLRANGDEQLLFDIGADYANDPPPLVPVVTNDHIDPLVLRLPGAAEPGFSAGDYTATITSERQGDLRITTISRAAGQRLDLNVFYVGAVGLSPRGDRGQPLLADALDEVDEILGQAGIFIGEVRQIAVGGALPMTGTFFDNGAAERGFALLQVRYGQYVELPGLFRLSAGASNSAINLFLLSDIEMRAGQPEPEAEAGGIPGPAGMQGTSGSGIAIAADMMNGDAVMLGRTLAHEIAHYLGLFHTSERDGRVLENLKDTPECRSDADVDGDGLSITDCQGLGADNLMFWGKTSGTVLTAEQRERLAQSPLLR